mgnify:CR=1 FL=1
MVMSITAEGDKEYLKSTSMYNALHELSELKKYAGFNRKLLLHFKNLTVM